MTNGPMPGEIEADWSSDWLDAIEAVAAAARTVVSVQKPGGHALATLRNALRHLDDINADERRRPAIEIDGGKETG